MAYKPFYDWMDKHEGRKDSSFEAVEKEKERQGVKKKHIANKMTSYQKIYNTPTPGLEEWRKQNHPWQKSPHRAKDIDLIRGNKRLQKKYPKAKI